MIMQNGNGLGTSDSNSAVELPDVHMQSMQLKLNQSSRLAIHRTNTETSEQTQDLLQK